MSEWSKEAGLGPAGVGLRGFEPRPPHQPEPWVLRLPPLFSSLKPSNYLIYSLSLFWVSFLLYRRWHSINGRTDVWYFAKGYSELFKAYVFLFLISSKSRFLILFIFLCPKDPRSFGSIFSKSIIISSNSFSAFVK